MTGDDGDTHYEPFSIHNFFLFFLLQVHGIAERNMERGLLNYGKAGYRGVTETWNVVQHEVAAVVALRMFVAYKVKINCETNLRTACLNATEKSHYLC